MPYICLLRQHMHGQVNSGMLAAAEHLNELDGIVILMVDKISLQFLEASVSSSACLRLAYYSIFSCKVCAMLSLVYCAPVWPTWEASGCTGIHASVIAYTTASPLSTMQCTLMPMRL